MIKKRYIYQWLLLPLIACLAAGIAGCGNELASPEEETASDGNTHIVIQTRAINKTDATSDDYVYCIRVMGYFADDSEKKLVVNQLYSQSEITIGNDVATLTHELEGNQKGVLHLYFIANEKWGESTGNGYEIVKAGGANFYLTDELDNIQTEDALKALMLHYTPVATYIKGTNPFLMVGQATTLIPSGQSEISVGVVDLVRAFAKLTVNFTTDNGDEGLDGTSITQLELQRGVVPLTYRLIEEKEVPYTPGYEGTENADFNLLSGVTQVVDNASLSGGNRSFTAYVPERILFGNENNEDNAWQLSVRVEKNNGRTLSGVVTLNNQDEQTQTGNASDYSIYRNKAYTVNATIPASDPLRLALTVNPWTEHTKELEWSSSTNSFTFGVTKSPVTSGDVKYYPVFHSPSAESEQAAVLVCNFTPAAPKGARWTASLSDGLNFELEGTSSGMVVNEGTPTSYQFQVKAKNALGTEEYREVRLVIRIQHADGTWNKLIINPKNTTSSGHPDEILIRQVPQP